MDLSQETPEIMIDLQTSESDFSGIPTLIKNRRRYFVIKRVFDFTASLFGIMFLLPAYIILSLSVALTSRGGIFFNQIRVGKDGKEFKIIKFRTMCSGAPSLGPQITVSEDTRITKVGQVLRKAKLDELPQLFNVLVGDMSLVGPRPEVPKYVDLYSAQQRNVLLVRPGITDLASIQYRNESELLAVTSDPETLYVEKIMPEKLSLNRAYLQDIGLRRDISIIFLTFIRIIRPQKVSDEVTNA